MTSRFSDNFFAERLEDYHKTPKTPNLPQSSSATSVEDSQDSCPSDVQAPVFILIRIKQKSYKYSQW